MECIFRKEITGLIIMRNFALRLLLLFSISWFMLPTATPHSKATTTALLAQGLPEWLVVEIFEAACASSTHFSDIGLENLLTYYADATATIEYLGLNPINPLYDRYRVVAGGGTVIVDIISET